MSDNKTTIKAKRQYKRKAKPRLIALEPRMLFDGAAVATVVDIHTQVDLFSRSASVDAVAVQNATPEFAAVLASISETSLSSTSPASANASADKLGASQSAQRPIEAAPADVLLANAVDARLTTLAQPAAANRHELVVVDGQLKDLQTLLEDIARIDVSRTVLVLDPASDETTQLTAYLQQHAAEFDAIHVMSHGGDGWISLGNQTLKLSNPEQNALLWETIKISLTEQGDVLLYGCNVANNNDGQAAIDAVANLTNADVAASTDTTGQTGDWVLEASSGTIETTSRELGF